MGPKDRWALFVVLVLAQVIGGTFGLVVHGLSIALLIPLSIVYFVGLTPPRVLVTLFRIWLSLPFFFATWLLVSNHQSGVLLAMVPSVGIALSVGPFLPVKDRKIPYLATIGIWILILALFVPLHPEFGSYLFASAWVGTPIVFYLVWSISLKGRGEAPPISIAEQWVYQVSNDARSSVAWLNHKTALSFLERMRRRRRFFTGADILPWGARDLGLRSRAFGNLYALPGDGFGLASCVCERDSTGEVLGGN